MSIVVISHARSGSTYLMQRLHRIRPLRVYLEIFHFVQETMLKALHEDAERMLPADERAALNAYPGQLRDVIVSDPVAYVRRLRALDPATVPVFKVFPGHLSDFGLSEVIDDAQCVLMLTRNLLHAYISAQIATATASFGGTDTSGERVPFVVDGFLGFADYALQHQRAALALAQAAGKPVVHLAYETLLAMPAEQHEDFTIELVHTLVPGAETGVQDHPVRHMRQDQRRSALEKVDNPEVLAEFLRRTGTEAADDALHNLSLDDWAAMVRDCVATA